MAPNTMPQPPRRPLTQKGVERKRPGPAPKPLSERLAMKAAKPVRRVERSYTRERKIEVLMFLLNHRVPDPRPRKVPRRRIGQPHEEELTQPMVATPNGDLVWYRAPTYAEASSWWKIPTPTIQGWWDSREKLLEGTGIEIPKVGPGGLAVKENGGAENGTSQSSAPGSAGEATAPPTPQSAQAPAPAAPAVTPAPGPVPGTQPVGPPTGSGAPPTPVSPVGQAQVTPSPSVPASASTWAAAYPPAAKPQPTPSAPVDYPVTFGGQYPSHHPASSGGPHHPQQAASSGPELKQIGQRFAQKSVAQSPASTIIAMYHAGGPALAAYPPEQPPATFTAHPPAYVSPYGNPYPGQQQQHHPQQAHYHQHHQALHQQAHLQYHPQQAHHEQQQQQQPPDAALPASTPLLPAASAAGAPAGAGVGAGTTETLGTTTTSVGSPSGMDHGQTPASSNSPPDSVVPLESGSTTIEPSTEPVTPPA
ncbi:hypothetical protein B0H63DRAFT_516370 [Podospora didyma]|uniref:Uncharacterized protein n=1 Tax=Podospora didyma TaxID=330526 RepID=A0AAE0P470_9PEZI|nr:hypothetical protein B0H63DRAFT_516370 [Podospora didyma]